MKISLPVYGRCCCGCDVLMVIQLLGEQENFIIRHNNTDEPWGKNGVYSQLGIITFDTNDLFIDKSTILNKEYACIKYENIKFVPIPERAKD